MSFKATKRKVTKAECHPRVNVVLVLTRAKRNRSHLESCMCRQGSQLNGVTSAFDKNLAFIYRNIGYTTSNYAFAKLIKIPAAFNLLIIHIS